ncbi:hypothetical protein [Streptomyces sp. NPDC059564]|uniref:hypothetical protein n=1 Tax=Streptomyces sp. NPDC059564 TaxID=3346865 RepID=UPI0036AFF9B0
MGPLRFGMSPGEACAALGGTRANDRYHNRRWAITCHVFREVGLKLYFSEVLASGVALVGRVPSELEQRLFDRAESREP